MAENSSFGRLASPLNPPTFGLACFDPSCFGKLCFPTEASPADPRCKCRFPSACRRKNASRGLNMLKTLALRGGLLFGGLEPFSLCLSVKRQSWTTPQTSVPVMAISPCLSKERQFQATEPCGAPRSPSEHCGAPCAPQPRSPAESRGSPFPRLAGGKVDRRHPRTAFSSTGKEKRDSQAHAMFP